MSYEIAKLLLEFARSTAERTRAVQIAIQLGMPLQEIEDYLDWLDMMPIRQPSHSPPSESPPSESPPSESPPTESPPTESPPTESPPESPPAGEATAGGQPNGKRPRDAGPVDAGPNDRLQRNPSHEEPN